MHSLGDRKLEFLKNLTHLGVVSAFAFWIIKDIIFVYMIILRAHLTVGYVSFNLVNHS